MQAYHQPWEVYAIHVVHHNSQDLRVTIFNNYLPLLIRPPLHFGPQEWRPMEEVNTKSNPLSIKFDCLPCHENRSMDTFATSLAHQGCISTKAFQVHFLHRIDEVLPSCHRCQQWFCKYGPRNSNSWHYHSTTLSRRCSRDWILEYTSSHIQCLVVMVRNLSNKKHLSSIVSIQTCIRGLELKFTLVK